MQINVHKLTWSCQGKMMPNVEVSSQVHASRISRQGQSQALLPHEHADRTWRLLQLPDIKNEMLHITYVLHFPRPLLTLNDVHDRKGSARHDICLVKSSRESMQTQQNSGFLFFWTDMSILRQIWLAWVRTTVCSSKPKWMQTYSAICGKAKGLCFLCVQYMLLLWICQHQSL